MAQKTISALVTDSISSLNSINQVASRVSRFVEVGGIDLRDFCVLASKIIKMEVDLVNMRAKLVKKEQNTPLLFRN